MNFSFLSTWWWAYIAALCNLITAILFMKQGNYISGILFVAAGIAFFATGTYQGIMGGEPNIDQASSDSDLPLPVPPLGGSLAWTPCEKLCKAKGTEACNHKGPNNLCQLPKPCSLFQPKASLYSPKPITRVETETEKTDKFTDQMAENLLNDQETT